MSWRFPAYIPSPFKDKLDDCTTGVYWAVYGQLLTIADHDGTTVCTAEYARVMCVMSYDKELSGGLNARSQTAASERIARQADDNVQNIAKKMGYEFAFDFYGDDWIFVRNIKWYVDQPPLQES
jgi:hypothetical protein